jgi:type II secretory pathway pseudopilin PulG
MAYNMSPTCRAFTLIETVIALGICTFSLVVILGMFTQALGSQRSATSTLRASQLATLILAQRMSAPTNNNSGITCALPALNRPFDSSLQSVKIGWDGAQTNAANAAFLLSYQAGTNAVTGSSLAQVRLVFSWPAQAAVTSASVGRYEISTQIPFY